MPLNIFHAVTGPHKSVKSTILLKRGSRSLQELPMQNGYLTGGLTRNAWQDFMFPEAALNQLLWF